MPLTDDLSDLYATTIDWRPLASRDRFNAPTYGAPMTFSARLVRKHRLVRDASGDQVVSSAQAWLKGAPQVAPDDQVTLTDGTSPPIVAVERFDDEDGPSHTVVMFR